jgi:hypothetical protein
MQASEWIRRYTAFWEARLGALARYLAEVSKVAKPKPSTERRRPKGGS